jgi:23S rRNA pseudouridine1911/1915/1917 synthase
MGAARILFENDDLLALDKPAGVSMATSSRPGKSGADVVARLLAACGVERPGSEPLLVHRLDVGTSGVVLLAKGDEAHRRLSRAFQEKGVHKTYRALVWGHPVPPHAVIDLPLGRDPKDGRKMKPDSDGKAAVTRYRTLGRLPAVADLELTPETGRTHQIRVHLAAKGHPIVGDDLYGGATRWRGVRNPAHRRALAEIGHPLLHAARVVIAAFGLDVAAPLPSDHAAVLDTLNEYFEGKSTRR